MHKDLIITRSDFDSIRDQATVLVASKMLPEAIKTPEQAIAIAMKGFEVGMPIMQSFAHIHVIKGKPCVSAEGMNYLIKKNCPQAVVDVVERTSEKCTIRACRRGHTPTEFTYTTEDAKKAQLLGNQSWQKYPRQMLFARAMSDCARVMFPDCINGISYTPEEMGADVDEDGLVIDVDVVPEDPVYEALDAQKKFLKDACLDNGITEQDEMRRLSELLKGKVTIKGLNDAVKDELAKKSKQEPLEKTDSSMDLYGPVYEPAEQNKVSHKITDKSQAIIATLFAKAEKDAKYMLDYYKTQFKDEKIKGLKDLTENQAGVVIMHLESLLAEKS